MATARGDVDIAVKLRGAREFASDSKRVSGSVDGIGRSVDRADGSMKQGRRGMDRLRGSMAMVGPVAAAAGAAVFTFGAVQAKQAVDTTLALAKSTMRLNRMTSLSTEENSKFAAVAKVRGIEDKQLGMMITRLSSAMVGYREGAEGARKALDFFGVSQDAIRKGDFEGVLTSLADGYANATDKARKNTYAQQLLGRQWQNIAPLLSQGSKGLREELDLAGDLGSIFSDLDIKNAGDLIKAQRQAQYATLGLQVALGKKLIPTLAKGAIGVTKFLTNWSKSRGTAGDIKKVFQDVGPVIAKVVSLLWRGGRALVNIWKRSKVVRTAIVSAFNLTPISGMVSGVLRAIRVFGRLPANVRKAGRSIAGVWRDVKNAFRSAINFVINGWNNLRFTLNLPSILPGPSKVSIDTPNIPQLASGGTILRSGLAMVGERGPELLRLPQGAQVQPLPAGAGFGGTVVTKVYLDRRQIAEAIGSEVASRKARR